MVILLISKETILKIGDHIEKMEMFEATLNTRPPSGNPDDEMFCHTHNAIELFGSIIIQSDYCDNTTNDTEYYIYNPDTDEIREATSEEDTIMRDMDNWEIDGLCSFREREDIEFVIAREPDNSITRPYFSKE